METERITPANEDYLEAIYLLATKDSETPQGVRSVDLAEHLDVTKASVNKAVNTLKDHKLIMQEHYGDIELTKEGYDYGKQIYKGHKTLRRFLIDELGVEPKVAENEACLMEHAISQNTLDKWVDYMDKND